MQRIHRYLTSFFLGAALITPVGLQAASAYDRDDRRVYDRDHKDYHRWDAHEDAAYRHWWMEERREREYRDYARIRREQQIEYWRWRHEHLDWH